MIRISSQNGRINITHTYSCAQVRKILLEISEVAFRAIYGQKGNAQRVTRTPRKRLEKPSKGKTESVDTKRLGKNGVHLTCGKSEYPHIHSGGDNLCFNIRRNEEDKVVLGLNQIQPCTSHRIGQQIPRDLVYKQLDPHIIVIFVFPPLLTLLFYLVSPFTS